MVVERIERVLHILARTLRHRERDAVEKRLRARVVPHLPRHHGLEPVLVRRVEDRGAARVVAGEIPAGEGRRHPRDRALVVGRDGLALGVDLARAVGIQLVEADGEKLHHLARVVLVGVGALRGVGLLAADHVEVIAHRGVQRHVLEELAVVREGVAVQHVHVRRHRVGIEVRRHVGDHEDLGERERHARAQLPGLEEPLLPDRLVGALLGRFLARRLAIVHVLDVRRGGEGELLGEPRIVAARAQGLDLGHAARPEGRLGEEARRVEHRRVEGDRGTRHFHRDDRGSGAEPLVVGHDGGEAVIARDGGPHDAPRALRGLSQLRGAIEIFDLGDGAVRIPRGRGELDRGARSEVGVVRGRGHRDLRRLVDHASHLDRRRRGERRGALVVHRFRGERVSARDEVRHRELEGRSARLADALAARVEHHLRDASVGVGGGRLERDAGGCDRVRRAREVEPHGGSLVRARHVAERLAHDALRLSEAA